MEIAVAIAEIVLNGSVRCPNDEDERWDAACPEEEG